MAINVPYNIRKRIIDIYKAYYQADLAGLVIFDPTPMDANFPHGEINILLVLHSASLQEQDRYDKVGETLIKHLVPDENMTCRIQTIDELKILAALKMPLVEIYLKHALIIYDTENTLHALQAAL